MTKYGKPQADQIIAMREQGLSPKVIAKAMDIPTYRINAIYQAAKKNRNQLDAIYDMKARGMTDSDIARAVGLSKQYVARLTVATKRRVKGDTVQRVINVDPGAWAKAQEVAEGFGLITDDGKDSGRGSIRKLIEQIGLGNLTVIRTGNLSDVL